MEVLYNMEFLQNVLGRIVIKCSGASLSKNYKGKLVYTQSKNFGISLGKYIIIGERASLQTLHHEYGHCLQSEKLGPLYLIVIGIPSITMNCLTRMGILKHDRYYDRWPENWADRLGGVIRKHKEKQK